ncbi:MAG: response regulator [Ignavibacteria bacterium]
MTTKPISIAIIDDHSFIANSLSQALAINNHVFVQGVYTKPNDFINALWQGAEIDLAISDFSMPSMNGIELLSKAKEIKPSLRRILISMHDLSELRYRCRRAGIEGYISRTSSIDGIQDYIQAVATGPVSLLQSDGKPYRTMPDNVMITPSELEVIRCVVCMELSSKATAEFLHRSHHTIEQHRKNIYAKLGIDGVAALTKYAIEAGICSK